MRLILVLTALLVAGTVALLAASDGGDPSQSRTETLADPERPLVLPKVGDRRRDCRLGFVLASSLLPGEPSAEAALGPGEGERHGISRVMNGPAYLMLPGIPRRALGLPTAADRRLGDGWGSSPALVLTRASYRGPLLLRGDRVDGAGALRFGAGPNPSDRLELPAGSWPSAPQPLRRWGVEHPPGARWRAWPTTLRLHTPGCYAVQVDGSSFSYVLVFGVAQTGSAYRR